MAAYSMFDVYERCTATISNRRQNDVIAMKFGHWNECVLCKSTVALLKQFSNIRFRMENFEINLKWTMEN